MILNVTLALILFWIDNLHFIFIYFVIYVLTRRVLDNHRVAKVLALNLWVIVDGRVHEC